MARESPAYGGTAGKPVGVRERAVAVRVRDVPVANTVANGDWACFAH